ncbi:adenosine receptor A3-like [Oculina patagonica]
MKQVQDPLYSSYIANCVFNVLSSYTAIMLNILTIHALRKTPSLPKTLKALLLSLAVSDLGVGLLVQPFYIALMVKMLQQNAEDKPSHFTLNAYGVIRGIFFYASFFGVVTISVDRFLAIRLHLRYQELVTHKRVVSAVISIWIFSALLSISQLWISFIVHAIIIGLCFICTAIIYCKIYFTVRRHTDQIQALQVQQVAQNGEMENIARQGKSALSTFYIYLVFLICYLPEYCRLVVGIVDDPTTISMRRFFLYSWTLAYLNSSLNPVIYCWKMRHIRHAILDILRNIFPSRD